VTVSPRSLERIASDFLDTAADFRRQKARFFAACDVAWLRAGRRSFDGHGQ